MIFLIISTYAKFIFNRVDFAPYGQIFEIKNSNLMICSIRYKFVQFI